MNVTTVFLRVCRFVESRPLDCSTIWAALPVSAVAAQTPEMVCRTSLARDENDGKDGHRRPCAFKMTQAFGVGGPLTLHRASGEAVDQMPL